MSAPILLTKLFTPATRPELVSRPRLIDQLNSGLHRKLTLISAPAGFGKTTLITEWLKSNGDDASSPFFAAWFSLDEGDNDAVRFLTYLVSTLNRIDGLETEIGSGALQMLQYPQPPPLEAILITVINEIALATNKIVLVLDDYHLIDSRQVHGSLNFLIENLPPQLHLVIMTREDPPIKIGRLRARSQLNEIRAVDLRFTSAETAQFLNQVMELNLSGDDISALETRTEGWIAGLQLAAISMQGSDDTAGFIHTFTGSNRMILDYLIEEVLAQQPNDIQTFLLKTSILNRLTGSLCDVLTGREDGQATLEALERTNLFIIPLDGERCWYRYHHLFADLLYQRLSQKQGEKIYELHANASFWYEKKGQVFETVRHAVMAGDNVRAAQLVEQYTIDLFTRGNLHVLISWVKALPDAVLRSRPWLCVYHAWGLTQAGTISDVEELLEIAESIVYSDHQPDVDESQLPLDSRKILENIAAIRANIAVLMGDFPRVIDQSQKAEKLLTSDNWASSVWQWTMGYAHYFQGDLDQATEHFSEVIRLGQSIENIYTITTGMIDLASVFREQGRLQQSVSKFQEALKIVEDCGAQSFGYVGRLECRLADVLCEQNELSEAMRYVNSGIEKSLKWKNPNQFTYAYQVKARVLFAQGNIQDSQKFLEKAEKMRRKAPIVKALTASLEKSQIMLWISDGNLSSADRWMDGIQIEDETLEDILRLISISRIMIVQGRLDDALEHLKKLEILTKRKKRFNAHIEVLILTALVLDAKSERDMALAYLQDSLTLAAKEGYVRVFVDEGPPMARLLYEALSRDIAPDYVRKLLAAFPDAEPEKVTVNQLITPDSDWIEPLSDRELEVLRLVADGLSRQGIAAKLVLSLNTVKTHIRNIYGKLGVNNQMQAVGKARGLGLLEND